VIGSRRRGGLAPMRMEAPFTRLAEAMIMTKER